VRAEGSFGANCRSEQLRVNAMLVIGGCAAGNAGVRLPSKPQSAELKSEMVAVIREQA
jgi:hypothetical protein